jgi:hypothetical protein
MLKICHRTAALFLAAAVLTGLVGCSGDKTAAEVAAMNKSNIQRLSNIYAAFQNFKGNMGPKDEAEFKAFIKEFDKNKLTMMGINPDKLDDVFTSERDSKPFKIRYKVGGGRGSVDPVVFEQEGKEGKKQVGFTGGKVEEVDDPTYQQLWAGKKPSQPVTPPKQRGGRPSGRPEGAPTGPPK